MKFNSNMVYVILLIVGFLLVPGNIFAEYDVNLKWTFETDLGRTPILGENGTVYITDNTELFAINSEGDKLWSFSADDEFTFSPIVGKNNIIYAGSRNGKIYAIKSDGTKKWSFQGEDRMRTPVQGKDGVIYVGCRGNKLYAINPDGTEKWNFEMDNSMRDRPKIYEDKGIVFVTDSEGKIYAINIENGTKKWSFEIDNSMISRSMISRPEIYEDKETIFATDFDGKLYAVDIENGTKKWSFEKKDEPFLLGEPVLSEEGLLYLAGGRVGNYLCIIDAEEGELLKTVETGNRLLTPVLGEDEENIYVVGGSGVIAKPYESKLFAFAPDGTEKWNFELGDEPHRQPTVGKGIIYVATGVGVSKLFAINTDGEKEWSFDKFEKYIGFSRPVVAEDTVYVGCTEGILYAIEKPEI